MVSSAVTLQASELSVQLYYDALAACSQTMQTVVQPLDVGSELHATMFTMLALHRQTQTTYSCCTEHSQCTWFFVTK